MVPGIGWFYWGEEVTRLKQKSSRKAQEVTGETKAPSVVGAFAGRVEPIVD